MEIEKQSDGGICKLLFSGHFTYNDSHFFRDAIDEIKSGKYHDLVVDMSGIDFIDSTAMGMLLLAKDEADNRNVRLIVSGVNGQPMKVMKIARLDTILNFPAT